MEVFWNYIVPILFISGAIVVIDYYFIGYTPALFGGHKWYTEKEIILYSMDVGKIRSNCFSPCNQIEEVRGYFTQVDSKIAVSHTCIYIGKKALSYHYKILLRDIVSVEGILRNKITFTMTFKVQSTDRDCFVEIDSFALTEATRNKFRQLTSFVKLNMAHPI